jgi:hypothetical protein
MNVSEKFGVGVAPNKSGVGVNVCGNTINFNKQNFLKKILRHPLKGGALRK